MVYLLLSYFTCMLCSLQISEMFCVRKQRAFTSILKLSKEPMIFIKISAYPHQMTLSKSELERDNTEWQWEGYRQHSHFTLARVYSYLSQAKQQDWLVEYTAVLYGCLRDLQFVTKRARYWRGSLSLFIPPSLLFSLSSSLPV